VLKDVISEVLETMFFATVEFGECGAEDRCSDYESEIDLLNHKGRICISLRVGEEFAKMITANFLGVQEHQVADDDVKDSLKELANMVGGGCQARLTDGAWELGIPRVCRIGPEGTEATRRPRALGFAFFGEPAGSIVVNCLPG
jgi:CheY-specific phosphatase CheX